MAMTADEAYAEAERRIEEAQRKGHYVLDLSDLAQLDRLPPLNDLSALQTLWLDNTEVADLSPLQSLSALTDLDLDYTEVADLRPIARLS